MSEAFARALSGTLTYDSASWDKLTALAMGSVKAEHRAARESLLNSLGVSLLGFKIAQRPDLFARASSGLRDFLGHERIKVGLENRGKVARLAIREWVVDICPTCSGSGHIFDSFGVEKCCGSCGGSLKRRYSDRERETELGFGGDKAERAMDKAHLIISAAVGFCVWQARRKFGP
jgi:hypothetical protein